MGVAATLSLLPFLLHREIEFAYKGLIAASAVLSTLLLNFGLPVMFYKMQSIKV